MKLAFLIIDMQKGCRDFCKCQREFDETVEYINEAASIFREKGYPVVRVSDIEVDGGPGSENFEFVDSIVTDENDIIIYKEYNNAFFNTKLHDKLQELGVEFVVISGFAAEYCLLFSYNGAKEMGYGVSLLQNGVAGIDYEEVKKMQLIRPVVSLEALEYLLK
ncbi:cysteine hydrolase family protein [Clostridium weizhouense]|uniref:Cysteine hydrolase n=1 Tax=Clostridium weizhouense TaxID=2859781 RepID=A0ABS7AN74_9CLOT|nr:isochorismatase family cysteine hydrolase [Clostridium weizhouense]MBW6410120.1 cysteine hydrolase [Clostridium weizhouense]